MQGERQRFAHVSELATAKDDVIRVFTGSGGGYGDPRERDPELVRADVRNGLLSPQRARDVYGVDTRVTARCPLRGSTLARGRVDDMEVD